MSTILGINAVFHDPARRSSSTARPSPRPRRSASPAASTARTPCRSRPGSCRSRRCGGASTRPASTPPTSTASPTRTTPSWRRSPPSRRRRRRSPTTSWEPLRTLYVRRVPRFLATAVPGLPTDRLTYVAHHVAHAASACVAAPDRVVGGAGARRPGESTSHLGGRWRDGRLDVLAGQRLPHSLGLLYEEVTAHLGFRRSSDEYKVMALASYGDPDRFGPVFRDHVRAADDGGFRVRPIDLASLVPARPAGTAWTDVHADLAAALQVRLEEVVLDLARWLHDRTGEQAITLAGGVALNCVANGRLAAEGPLRARVGAARRRRLGHRARVGARPGGPSAASGARRSRPRALGRGLGRRRDRGDAEGRRAALRASRRPRRGGGGRPRRRARSSAGSRVAASTGPGPSATAACCATPGAPRTWGG